MVHIKSANRLYNDVPTRLVTEDGEYMSFGVSGAADHSQMVGGDVAVTWVDKSTLKGFARDYYLDAKSQCAGVRGSCPDERLGVCREAGTGSSVSGLSVRADIGLFVGEDGLCAATERGAGQRVFYSDVPASIAGCRRARPANTHQH